MKKILRPMEGVKLWRNPANEFVVFEVHYTADEEKCSPEWKKAAMAGMPIRKWQQEYEISWLTFDGLPVYGDWDTERHCPEIMATPQIGLPLLIGFDFGLTCAAVVGQYQGQVLHIFREYTSINMGIERFSEHVVAQNRVHYARWASLKKDWLCFIDPAGTFRKDTDEGTCAKILDQRGYSPIPGPVSFEARKSSVENFLTRSVKDGPCLRVNHGECPVLVRGFEGGYRYPQKAADIQSAVLAPIKDGHSHPHDALQYLCSGVKDVQARLRRQAVPRPSYRF